jgi:hypothetical protein
MRPYLTRAAAVAAAPALALLVAVVASAPPAAAGTTSATAKLRCDASMTNRHPADYTSTGIKVHTAAHAHIRTVAHYKTVDHAKYATANANGRRTVWYYISGATPGYRVVVDVYVHIGSRHNSCATSFTPHA